MNHKLKTSLASGAILLTALVVSAWLLGSSSQERALNITFIAVGIALGWMLGILASPYDKKEQLHFSELTKAMSVFVSGYALAKVGRLLDTLVSPDVLLQPIAGFRALSVLGATVTAAVVTFVFRQYWRVD
jgi:hypothetical protein